MKKSQNNYTVGLNLGHKLEAKEAYEQGLGGKHLTKLFKTQSMNKDNNQRIFPKLSPAIKPSRKNLPKK